MRVERIMISRPRKRGKGMGLRRHGVHTDDDDDDKQGLEVAVSLRRKHEVQLLVKEKPARVQQHMLISVDHNDKIVFVFSKEYIVFH